MIEFPNGTRLVQSVSELPNLLNARNVYPDFETTSGDKSLDSLNPWHNCKVAGLAITADDMPGAWYIPIAHHDGQNIDRASFVAWFADVMRTAKQATNANIKYDMHVAKNDLGVDFPKRVRCLTSMAKIYDSNMAFRGGYGLDVLSRCWLHEDIAEFELAMKPWLNRNKDYGAIPADVMAPYAGQDVITDRRLDKFLRERTPEQCNGVVATEEKLTRILFRMEQYGMQIDPSELRKQEFINLATLSAIDERLTALVGRSFNPKSTQDCFDVLCNHYGLPIMGYTIDDETGEFTNNPSFDKKAMAAYLVHPNAPREVVELIGKYRKTMQFNSLFVTKFQSEHVDSILHPSYNQIVRTGRMGCSEPNMQQNDKQTKGLIHPRKGNAFFSADYSQIEFRTIVHYIKDQSAIAAFAQDPDIDFHEWVARECGLPLPDGRDAAKTLNFMIAFGGGKAKTQKLLAANALIIGELSATVSAMVDGGKIKRDDAGIVFNQLCFERAETLYNRYHAALPGIKQVSRQACDRAKDMGYVFNLYGRHRKLPEDRAHIAFNTLNQSSAADIMKERTVAISEAIEGTGIELSASVHDELVLEGNAEMMEDARTVNDLVHLLENPAVSLRVPIRTSHGLSRNNWREATTGVAKGGQGGKKLPYPVAQYGDFAHLRA